MAKVFFSLGSSLGAKQNLIESALKSIENQIGEILKISEVYETEPWGFQDENYFYNIAITVETEMQPLDLLDEIHKIENEHNRVRSGKRYIARTLDIDIIFYDDNVFYTENLQIPHKHAHKRKFVLQPIFDIDPDFIHPLLKESISKLLNRCEDNLYIKKVTL